jgi:hypothetical protein
MHYSVDNEGNRYFEVKDDQQQPVGTLEYQGISISKASITISTGGVYDVDAADFWLMTKQITRNGELYAELRARMGKGITLTFRNGHVCHFFKKSFWNTGEFTVLNEAEEEIAELHVDFEWRSFSFKYEIDIFAGLGDAEMNHALPMILLYCARFLRTHHAAVT